ncbi:tumor necrosis factor receptor superfamily member 14-like [Dromiciops gliroides]|uniref:tumor necrosis factor receptor superfamily member 14-like n=1 Tax=Dromiciops gliroides TaxID=33562 RepID=UPI001CC4DA08|nr:tumor necrosis factor receptor superfamily member 14-like [Dromiciops gliroides]
MQLRGQQQGTRASELLRPWYLHCPHYLFLSLPKMFIMFIITQLIPFMEALKCMAGESEVDGQCCPTCPPGFRVHEPCRTVRGITCVPCEPGTYTAQQSVLKKCLQCKVCDPALGFLTRKECSSTSNTVCSCSPGYFCASMKDDDCEMCIAHRDCSLGQYVKSRGTQRKNTICERCPAGTFSPSRPLHYCLSWTNCRAQGLSEEKPGTDTTDALCSLHSNFQPRIIIILNMVIISVLEFV